MLRMLRRVRSRYRGKTRVVGGGDDGDNGEEKEGERRSRRLASPRRLPLLLPTMSRGWGGLLGPARDGKGQWCAGAFVGAVGALVLCAGVKLLSGDVLGPPSVVEVSSCPVSERGRVFYVSLRLCFSFWGGGVWGGGGGKGREGEGGGYLVPFTLYLV